MAANKGKGTKLEIMFGKFLWNAGTRTVANSLPLFLRYSAKSLFFKRLYQTIENIKYKFLQVLHVETQTSRYKTSIRNRIIQHIIR